MWFSYSTFLLSPSTSLIYASHSFVPHRLDTWIWWDTCCNIGRIHSGFSFFYCQRYNLAPCLKTLLHKPVRVWDESHAALASCFMWTCWWLERGGPGWLAELITLSCSCSASPCLWFGEDRWWKDILGMPGRLSATDSDCHRENGFSFSFRVVADSPVSELWVKQLVICRSICLMSFLSRFHDWLWISEYLSLVFFQEDFREVLKKRKDHVHRLLSEDWQTPHFDCLMWLSQPMFALAKRQKPVGPR